VKIISIQWDKENSRSLGDNDKSLTQEKKKTLTDKFGQTDSLTHGRNILVSLQQVALTLDSSDSTMGPVQVPSCTRAAVSLRDHRVQLWAIEQRIGRRTHTGWIISLVIGKCTPLRTGVHDPIAQHQPTVCANKIAR